MSWNRKSQFLKCVLGLFIYLLRLGKGYRKIVVFGYVTTHEREVRTCQLTDRKVAFQERLEGFHLLCVPSVQAVVRLNNLWAGDQRRM